MFRFLPLALCLCAGCAPAQNAPSIQTVAATPAREVPTAPALRAKLQDKSLDELSGLAASRRYPGLLWCHNDSGDSARVFAINQKGETVATVNFVGLEARDWEDITLAGEWLYIGEIGDNFAANPDVRIYRIHEPTLDPGKLGQNVDLKNGSWEEMTLHYPGGARDAETLAATPDGHILIVSKDKAGSNFYTLPGTFENGKSATMKALFSKVQFGYTGWLTKLVTGGDLSPDGKTLVMTAYSQITEFPLARPFDFASLQIAAPKKQELPPLKQCESVCFNSDGRSLWVSSEGQGAPLWEMPM